MLTLFLTAISFCIKEEVLTTSKANATTIIVNTTAIVVNAAVIAKINIV